MMTSKMVRKTSLDKGQMYFLLLVLFELRTFFFQISPAITVVMTGVVLLVNIYYIFSVNTKHQLIPFFKGLNLFLSLLTLYGLILILTGERLYIHESGGVEVNTTAFLIRSITSLGPIYAFYDIGLRNLLYEKRMIKWFYILIMVSIILFMQNRAELIADGKNASEITNNMGYLFASLIPYIFFFKKSRMKQYFFLYCLIAMIIVSAKRGAIVVATIAMTIFFITAYKESSPRKRLGIVILTSLFLLIGTYIILDYYSSNSYLQYRVQRTISGDASNRDIIYLDLLMRFSQESFLEKIVGNGAWSTLKFSDNFAHQDWLEILIDMGLLGITAYLIFWRGFIKSFLLCKKIELYTEAAILICICVMYLTKSLFSMSFELFGLIPGLCIGYALSNYTKKSIKYKVLNK